MTELDELTKEEILSMPAGQKMDELISLLLNESLEHPDFWYEEGYSEGGGYSGFYCIRCGTSKGLSEKHPCAKSYSQSISSTMEVIEKVMEWGDVFIEWWRDGEWFICDENLLNRKTENFPYISARCDGKETGKPSLPLAICRFALLKWLEM
jgi:hypothetical protein